MIDPKDLRQLSVSDFNSKSIGGVFYKKESNGSFSHCRIFKEELIGMRGEILKYETTKLAEQGLLYTRINRPWKAFE